VNKISIYTVIVTFNGSKWIDTCIGSLFNSNVSTNIIVIDNASTDDTVYKIESNYKAVNIIRLNENLGFGRGNNIGIKMALERGASHVFLLNQDAWVEKNTLKSLLYVAEKNSDFNIFCPMHLMPGHQQLEWHFSTYIVPEKCANLYSDIYFNKVGELYEVAFLNAAAWFINRATIEKLGGFDPLFPHYGEDDDYINRLHYYGLKMAVVPSALITHDITIKSWEIIKFDKNRQLIFAFLELKDIRFSLNYLLFQFLTSRIGKLFRLLILRKWKEFNLMCAVYFITLGKLNSISRSRKIAKRSYAYL